MFTKHIIKGNAKQETWQTIKQFNQNFKLRNICYMYGVIKHHLFAITEKC
jgi:hypothetical protein